MTAHEPLPGSSEPDLRRVPGVVQHDQDPPVSQLGPVQGGALLRADRDLAGLDAEVPQHPGQHVLGQRRLLASPAQADVELAAGEVTAQLVRGMHGQGGLAESGGACHHGDGHSRGVIGP